MDKGWCQLTSILRVLWSDRVWWQIFKYQEREREGEMLLVSCVQRTVYICSRYQSVPGSSSSPLEGISPDTENTSTLYNESQYPQQSNWPSRGDVRWQGRWGGEGGGGGYYVHLRLRRVRRVMQLRLRLKTRLEGSVITIFVDHLTSLTAQGKTNQYNICLCWE